MTQIYTQTHTHIMKINISISILELGHNRYLEANNTIKYYRMQMSVENIIQSLKKVYAKKNSLKFNSCLESQQLRTTQVVQL